MGLPLSRPVAVCLAGVVGAWMALAGASEDFFEARIRPVLAEHCYECHSASSRSLKGGLRLDTRDGVRRGGDSGPILVPGDPAASRLVEAIRYGNRELQMPPHGRLPDAVIDDLSTWVRQGAVDPREPGVSPANQESTAVSREAHWAFQPIADPGPPVIPERSGAVRSPVDAFIRTRLDAAGLSPSPPADRRTLIRRLSFDLLGLPPSPDEVEAFVQDPSPDAPARWVERLLASPHYGERWGRWWLDLARYADTNGQDENKVMSNAWRYRDWVIRAFNANLPFDQFITAQLAGDLMPTNGVPEEVVLDRWMATGLLILGPKMLAEQDKPKLVMDLVDEQIDVVTRAFLGLTVGCARCHDHKFDPIPARDYYALAGIFKSTRAMENLEFVSKFNERPVSTRAQRAAIEAHEQQLTAAKAAVTEAVRLADLQLRSSWREDLAAVVTAMASGNSAPPASDTNSPPYLQRLAAVGSAGPDSQAMGGWMRELAAHPGGVAARLRELESDAGPSDGLRVGPGRVGGGFVATGRNHLEIPHSPELEPERLTVETWVRAPDFPGNGDARRWLINKNGNEWEQGHYALVLDRDRPGAYLNIGGGRENVFVQWSEGPRLQSNRWHHLAFTYDGARLRLFVDGRAAGETQVDRGRAAGTGPLALGKRQDGYVHFRGGLDEARVYGRALDPEEIAVHAERPDAAEAHGDPAARGVVARWEFNDLTPAEREAVSRAELREAVFGPAGLLALPADSRRWYPEATLRDLTRLEQERDALSAAAPPPVALALAAAEDAPVSLPVFVRGSHLNPGKEPVPRGFIQVVNRGASAAPAPPPDRSGRLELARWLTSPEQPLTARVIVNRVWQAHFGEGLVRTPDNFGVRGEAPSHPALLDWLAREFMRSGWDLKHLHRLLLNSATYRQSSVTAEPDWTGTVAEAARAATVDPDHRLLAHMPRQRLEAEMVRDALLAVSGRLDPAMGGTLVGWKNNEYAPADDVSEHSVRRSVYLPVVRDRVYDVFTLFDFANPSVGTARRTPTVVSHQALFFLNSPLVRDCARSLAESVLTAGTEDSTRLRRAYELLFSRPPTETETVRAVRFLQRSRDAATANAELTAWSALCQSLMASNEFLYRE